jgi:hypothetical protein
MEPLLDRIARGDFDRHKPAVRWILIIGASLCAVIGAKWIAEDIVYNMRVETGLLVLNTLAFVPLIALAPRYKKAKVVYSLIGLLEALIIIMGNSLTVR